MSSAAQTQWEEIAASLRARLAKLVTETPAMNPDEVKMLIDAASEAQWLEIRAQSYDAWVDERRKTLEREAMFGG